MANHDAQDGAAASEAFWDGLTRRLGGHAPLEAFGTVTEARGVVALRDELERAHVLRRVRLTRASRVLDLGGGAGRFALRIAPHVSHVTLVDVSAELLDVARARARAAGIENVTFVQAAAQRFRFEERYDLILVMGVATYLNDDELADLAERCARGLAPGGQLALKEPVTTDGAARDDHGPDPDLPYHARFRPREVYAQVFGRALALRYQSPTVAHLIPWFLGSTEGAVQATASPAAQRLLELARPLFVRADPWLLAAELRLRASSTLAPLLAPVPVLQDLYVFEQAAAEAPASAALALSVIVIAYNEEECVAGVVEELAALLDREGVSHELVLVDDGSADGTLAAMHDVARRRARVRVLALGTNRGIGGALRAGFDAATGAYVTWIPADGQIMPATVVELYRRRDEGTMLTTVYRTRDDPWFRTLISQSLNGLIKLRTGQVAKSGGNYLFARAAWIEHAPAPDDSMMISTAFRHNLRRHGRSIVEVEIDCRARVAGRSKVLNARTILRTLDALRKSTRIGSRR